MRQNTGWNVLRDRRNPGGRSGGRRRRSSIPSLESLEGRIALSTGASAIRVYNDPPPLGDGIGVKQVVVVQWQDKPLAFLINTNDQLFYAYPTVSVNAILRQPAGTPPRPEDYITTYTSWMFVTGAAKEISAGLWNNLPYLYLINSNDELYYGHLTPSDTRSGVDPLPEFSGWTFVTGAAKQVEIDDWGGNPYLFLINSNDELYYGSLYVAGPSSATPGQAAFSGWTFVTGAAKQVDVDQWRNSDYLYLINSNDELYYGNLYFDPSTPGTPSGHASFSGWTFVTGAAKQVEIGQLNGDPYLYLINSNDELYYGNLAAAGTSAKVRPGPSSFSGWTFVTGAAKDVTVGRWNGSSYLYLINSNDELYYGSLGTAYYQTSATTWTSYTAFGGWTYLTGAAKTVDVAQWEGHPIVALVNSRNDLYFGNLYPTRSKTPPWNIGLTFGAWIQGW